MKNEWFYPFSSTLRRLEFIFLICETTLSSLLPSGKPDCNGILVKKRRMCFNLSRGSELTTLVKSTITTFQGPWPREGVTPDLIWASFMRTFFGSGQMAKLSKGFFMRKICRQEWSSIFISLCGGPRASVTSDEVGRIGYTEGRACARSALATKLYEPFIINGFSSGFIFFWNAPKHTCYSVIQWRNSLD